MTQPPPNKPFLRAHAPGIVRGLIMGGAVVLVALVLKHFEQRPDPGRQTQPTSESSWRPPPVPADTTVVAAQNSRLPCVVFVCDPTAPRAAFPAADMLEDLRTHAADTFLIRVELGTDAVQLPGNERKIMPPAVLILGPEGGLRHKLEPPVSAQAILDKLGMAPSDSSKRTQSKQEGKP